MILITGGSRSGKSNFAEKMLLNENDVLYIATSIATDEDMEERIKIHRLRRNPKWHTYEGYRKLGNVIKNGKYEYILIECIGTLVTNIMFEVHRDFDTITNYEIHKLEKDIFDEIKDIILAAKESKSEVIFITNEVGLGLVPEYRLGRIFSDILGRVNQFMADNSNEVYIVFCGSPLKLK
ncbi:bifunctional adenosylcobinamide kinase/adenosylcobinamide-phosphate guanylyltransferase [Clostridium sp. LBM24168]